MLRFGRQDITSKLPIVEFVRYGNITPTKRGAEKVLAMPKGGHKKFWGNFYAVA